MSALVLVGRGRYEDPWHDHAAVAHEVARVLADGGLDVTVRGTFPGALDGVVTGAGGPELVVVVAGTGRTDPDFDGTDEDWSDFHAALDSLVGSGVPLLALHASANTFTDSPVWGRHLGGRWVPGVSMHPPIGEARFTVSDVQHPVTAGLGDVTAFDERYCDLEVDPASTVLLTTEHEGREHPVVWVAPGPGRVLYDALGHDHRSFASASRRELLRREVAWLTAPPGGRAAST